MPEETTIHHPELLTPIHLPAMRSNAQVIIGMDEYKAYERFREQIAKIENATERGRLEGRIEGLRLVLSQVDFGSMSFAPLGGAPRDAIKREIGRAEQALRALEAAEEAFIPARG